MRSTLVSRAFNVSLKQRPISFLLILLTAHISLNVRGTPSWRQAIYRQADALASLERPLRFFPSWTYKKTAWGLNQINRELEFHLFEQVVGPIDNGFGQVNAIGHRGYLLKGWYEGAIRAAHGASVLVLGCSKGVKGCGSCARTNYGGQVAATEQRILRSTDTTGIHAALLVAKGTPLGAHINYAVPNHQTTLGANHIASPVVLDERRFGVCVAAHLVVVQSASSKTLLVFTNC